MIVRLVSVFLLIVILAAALLTGCNSNERAYDNAISKLTNGNFEEAIVLFKSLPENYYEIIYENAISKLTSGNFEEANVLFMSLPEDYLETAYYITVSKIIHCYEVGEWEDAAQLIMVFAGEEYEKCSDSFKENSKKAVSFLNDVTATPIEGISWNIYMNLYGACLINYFNEKIENDDKSVGLSTFPHSFWVATTWMRNFYYPRIEEARINVEKYGLTEYYDRDDSSLSPINATGAGLYLSGSVHSGLVDMLITRIPPNYFADTPEKIRYVITFTDVSHTYYGVYSDGVTKGFTTKLLMILKDVTNGTVLLRKYYSVDPPAVTEGIGDVNGYFGVTDVDEMMNDLITILEELFPILRS